MKRIRVKYRSCVVILESAINVAGHADQCTEVMLRKTGQELTALQKTLRLMQSHIDNERTRRYNEQAEKGNVK